ncbi:MAG: hypothetical protein AAFS10_07040, partial [Myxococcota bacterium]
PLPLRAVPVLARELLPVRRSDVGDAVLVPGAGSGAQGGCGGAGRAFAYTEDGSPIGFYRHEGVDALEPMEMEVGYAPMTRLWEVCQGDCTYDAHGNLLEDRDLYRQDAVYYDYTCWTER